MQARDVLVLIRKGMEVRTSDGDSLGKVAEVWWGTDPTPDAARCDEDVCSRVEVRRGLLGMGSTIYVPYSAIADISGGLIRLSVDSQAVRSKGWSRKPRWIPGGRRGVRVPYGYEPPGSGPVS
jgi:hypothetical protein